MNRREMLKGLIGGSFMLAVDPINAFSQGKNSNLEEKLFSAYKEVDSKFNVAQTGEDVLVVDGRDQKMHLVNYFSGEGIKNSYDVSTAKKGFGNISNSDKTPTGIHKIAEKIGSGAEVGTIFVAKKNTGNVAEIYKEKFNSPRDYITTRIMSLEGCEENNENSFSRYIYIHGTPEEGLIGTPESHGCIRMKNDEAIQLYDLVDVGTYVNIKENLFS